MIAQINVTIMVHSIWYKLYRTQTEAFIMKIFISGTKTVSMLSEKAVQIINGYIKRNYDIIIGDCMGTDKTVQQHLREKEYNAVTVYHSGKSLRNNVGNWECKKAETKKKKYTFEFNRQKDSAMVEESDKGFMIWDLKSKGTFSNICEMLLNNKCVEVYNCINDILYTFNTFDEFKTLIKEIQPETEIPATIYEEMLDTFMLSKDMADYLKTQVLSDWSILELICGSPVELTVKAEWLKKLSKYQNVFLDISDVLEMSKDDIGHTVQYYINSSYYHCYLEIKKALHALNLKKGEQFYLKGKWYDTDDWLEKEYGNAPCLSVEKAKELIKEDFDEDDNIKEAFDLYEECCNWAELEKWVLKNNDFIQTYNYYLLKDKICYFEEIIKKDNYYGRKEFRYSLDARHLNLPVPFVAGDIVDVDCTPFAPKRDAVILEIWDNRDCCSLTALYKNHNNVYCIGAVKHAHLFEGDNAEPLFSPLYKMKKCETEDEILLSVSKYLNGDEQKGEEFWKKLHGNDYLMPEQILKVLEGKE